MINYTVKRILLAIVTVLVAMTLLFSMVHIVPGDPASIALGPRATPAMIENFRRDMGLDKPVPVQLAIFLGNVLKGDLGKDVWTGVSVAQLVFSELPYTVALTVAGLGWALVVGIPLGCYSAIRRGGWIDKSIGLFAVSSIAIPSFVVSIYSLLVFAVWLRWLPALGAGPAGEPLQQLRYLVLPSFSIGLGWVGYLSRLVRASMLEVMGENHIRTARAFGLPERRIIFTYALRIAILPTVAVLGVGVGRLLSGAVFAEIVFNRPGIGKLVYDGVIFRNYPVVMGAVLVTTAIFVVSTLAADLAAAKLDPRTRDKL